MQSELIQKVADKHWLSYEDTYKIISHQFAALKDKLSDPSCNALYISKIGTYVISKSKLSKRLQMLISYTNKKKYIHDSIQEILQRGVTPYIEDTERSI